MTASPGVHVYSEIGPLRRVMLHRPNKELENITPENMGRLLFDDIPEAHLAAKEHDYFADVLRQCGTEVVYVEDYLRDVLQDEDTKKIFIKEFLEEAKVYRKHSPFLHEYLMSREIDDLVNIIFSGLRNEEFSLSKNHLAEFDHSDLLWFDPMPNILFMRDPMTVIGNGVALNCMWSETRDRESMILEFIYRYHPDFAKTPKYFRRDENVYLEGGDVLVLSPEVLLVGVSQRTEATAVETLAQNLLGDPNSGFKHVLVFMIPRLRAFMHLDTVFTMIDRDMFIMHQAIDETVSIYDITMNKDGSLNFKSHDQGIAKALCDLLDLPAVKIIPCGGESEIDAEREQWSDGANTLTVAPGEVIVYERNRISNRLLREAGIKVHEIKSSELSRGRGGPRCMSMPLWREDI